MAARDQGLCIGLDVGTSGVKAIVVGGGWPRRGERRRRLSAADAAAGLDRAGAGGVVAGELRGAARRGRAAAGAVAALGLTGQMHGAVFLDADGEVIRPALLWNDQRTAAAVRRDRARGSAPSGCVEIAGNPALTGFQAPKILWLRAPRAGGLRARPPACCCPRTSSASC